VLLKPAAQGGGLRLEDLHPLALYAALGVLELHPHRVADQSVQLPTGRDHGQGLFDIVL
jgi:hypothetical protein